MEVESDAVNSGLIYREGDSSPKIERERETEGRIMVLVYLVRETDEEAKKRNKAKRSTKQREKWR